MMKDIEAGRVNCVVVKDLSRFGRDYIEAGRYLEKIFPVLGVRFIALTDYYDSISADTGERQIVIPVKNFINDSYLPGHFHQGKKPACSETESRGMLITFCRIWLSQVSGE